MCTPLRVALLVDPLTLAVKGGDHAPELARELLGRGHVVRGFGAPPGIIPRSGEEPSEVGTSGAGPLSFAPDVLIAYDALSPAAWLGARTARRLGASLVLVEVGAEESQSRLHERLLQGIGRRLWGSAVRAAADAVIALDPVAQERAVIEGFDPQRVTRIARGVELQRFRSGQTSELLSRHRVRGRVLLYAGRFEADRGIATLLTAFARTVGQRHDWTLVLAGEGSDESSLQRHADRAGVADRVRWIRRPRPEEMPGLVSAATLVAVPALDDAVLGKQVLRALASGVPVLCSDRPRLSWLFENDEAGLIVPPGDAQAWTEALQRAAGDPQARRRWGSAGRALAEERFAWPVTAERIERILSRAHRERAELERARSEVDDASAEGPIDGLVEADGSDPTPA